MGGAGNKPKGADGTLCGHICTAATKQGVQIKVGTYLLIVEKLNSAEIQRYLRVWAVTWVTHRPPLRQDISSCQC